MDKDEILILLFITHNDRISSYKYAHYICLYKFCLVIYITYKYRLLYIILKPILLDMSKIFSVDHKNMYCVIERY